MKEAINLALTSALIVGTASAQALTKAADTTTDEELIATLRDALRLQAMHSARMNDLIHLLMVRIDQLEVLCNQNITQG